MALLAYGTTTAQTFQGTGGPIPDDGPSAEFTLNVEGLALPLQAEQGLERICLNILHPWCSDMDVKLVNPAGVVIDLFSGVGGDGDNFTGTCLSADAPITIAQASAPFTGTFRPMSPLGNVNNGTDGNGTWRLRIRDTYPFADAGSLVSWSMTFGPNAPGPFTLESTDLPLVMLETNGQEIPDGPKIPALMHIVHNGPGSLNHPQDLPNVYTGHIGIQRRGNFSNILPQKPYNVETRFADGSNRNVTLLGMPSENDWILLAGYNDKSLMRNALAFELFRAMGHYAPRIRMTEVMLNGQYQGIYMLTERIKRDNSRVNIATLNPFENSGDDLTGGYIFKVDYFTATNSWTSPFSPLDHPSEQVHFVYHYPEADIISPQQREYLRSVVTGLETALYSEDFADPGTGYRAWLHTGSFIDYFLVNELARNVDGFKKSRFFHKDKDSNGGLIMSGPVWDFDWAWMNVQECYFGATDGSGWSHRINDCNPDINSPGWVIRLLKDPAFANELQCRYRELRQNILSEAHLEQVADSIAAVVAQAQQRHFTRWPIWGLNSGTPEIWPLAQSYAEEVQRLKNWLGLRLQWLDANMPGTCTSTTGLPVAEAPRVRAFPNPARDLLRVEVDRPDTRLELLDATGRMVLQGRVAGYDTALPVGALAPGAYMLRTTSQDGPSTTLRIVVEP